MTTLRVETPVRDVRSVGRAADSLARAVRREDGSADGARDRLLDRAERATAAPPTNDTDEELLAAALSQLSIGSALLTADSAPASPVGSDPLRAAAASLERTAVTLEEEAAEPEVPRRFEASPNGIPLDVAAAAWAALDEMAEAAAAVATALLDKAMKPVIGKLPESWQDSAEDLVPAVGSQVARCGLRAVRRAMDLLLTIVHRPALEQVRDRIDSVLKRLGGGRDATVLLGWAIGVETVREHVPRPGTGNPLRDDALVGRLVDLAARYDRLCRLLRHVAVALLGVAAALAYWQVVSPQVAALSGLGLAVVLGAVIVLGRDHTGAHDLPGSTRGVRLLVPAMRDAPA